MTIGMTINTQDCNQLIDQHSTTQLINRGWTYLG